MLDFTKIILRMLTLCSVCSFFLMRERTNQERALRGRIPLRTPQRANVAALPLRSCLRENMHLQLLRRCFKEKHRHGRRTRQAKEKGFAICDAPYFNIIYQQTGGPRPSPTKTARIFAFSVCRAWWLYSERCRKSIYVFLVFLFVARQS